MRLRTVWCLTLMVLPPLGGCGLISTHRLLDGPEAVGGACRPVLVEATGRAIPGGVEDIAPDRRTGAFYASATDWAGRQRGDSSRPGSLHLITFGDDGEPRARDVTPPGLSGFNPHGVDLWTGPDGRKRLFVVNHRRAPGGDEPRVEIFDIGPNGGLSLTDEGIAHRELRRPNDVAALGPRTFFVSNDHRAPPGSGGELLETLLPLPHASVFLGHEGALERARGGLAFANGLAMSLDGRKLFVSETSRGRVSIFEVSRDLSDATRALTPASPRSIPVGAGPDNLYMETADRLWVTAHNSGSAFFDHVKHVRAGKPPQTAPASPARVLLIRPSGGSRAVKFQTTAASLKSGAGLSTMSIGVPAGRGLLIGAIFPEGVLFCTPGS